MKTRKKVTANRYLWRISAVGLAGILCLGLISMATAWADSGPGGGSTRIEARFAGAPLNGLVPEGRAEFEVRSDGHREFEVRVENVNLPNGTPLNVLIENTKLVTLTLSGLRAELRLETRNGAVIPDMNSRTRITITDQAGNTVLAGSFSNIPPPDASPSPTPSPGATPSPTPTPGATPSPTPTPGATPSPTPTPGATPSPTPTPAATPSPTPTPGATPSPTPTPGATPSPTPTPGATPSPTPTPTPSDEFRIEARLAGAAINGLVPKGQAKFGLRDGGTRRRLNVEVEKVNLPAGTVLNVLVDNVKVGQIALASNLETELELDTNKGNFVPNVLTNSTVVVTNAQGATLLSGVFNTLRSISGLDIDHSGYFVEQHYRDFFDREADDSGLSFWEGQITNCANDPGCRERSRVNTSGAFFLAIEFQDTGYLLYRFNKASFGVMPRRIDFLIEMQSIAQGVVVGASGWQQKLEDNKRLAAERWVNRHDFVTRFQGLSNRQFVDALFSNAGTVPNFQEKEALIQGLDVGTETRATVLRKIAENADFTRKETNPAFVLMQYFGYLHRNPDEGPDHDLSGFNFWLNKLNAHGGNFHAAEMVKAFIQSGEYRNRFNW